MPRTIDAIIFDLYGTLLRIGTPLVARGLPRALGVSFRPWLELARRELLVSRFASPAELVRRACEALSPARSAEAEARCNELLEQELASVVPVAGARSLLAFLQRRGYALGLLSNLTSAHKEPVSRLGLQEFFAACSYSCDEGRIKPDHRLYLELCQRLSARPERTLVIGDSLANDVETPRALGMRALHVGNGTDGRPQLGDLAWRLLDGDRPEAPLLGEIAFAGPRLRVRQLEPVADGEQGRYNLVARAAVERARPAAGAPTAGDAPGEVFVKRFLFPEAAHVELFAHEVMAAAGVPVCQAALVEGEEPCLAVTRAPGAKFQGPVDPPLAFEVARQCAAAYVFSNADLRPRNAFVAHASAGPRVTMIDLEHCFFNLALDVAGLADPLQPATFDGLDADEITRRLRRRVLSERTTRRAMRTFVELERLDSDVGDAFRRGWISAYETMRERRGRLCELMLARVYRAPYLIIGTQAYRRAMARLDVEDIQQRLGQDPEQIFPLLAAVKGGGE
jgi:HAD superfamily hydrolase (TIGR01549 family)